VPAIVAWISRSACGPLYARKKNGATHDRVCGARLPRWLWLEGLPAKRVGLRREIAGRSATGIEITGPNFHSVNQERRRSRPQYRSRLGGSHGGRGIDRVGARSQPRTLSGGKRIRRISRNHYLR